MYGINRNLSFSEFQLLNWLGEGLSSKDADETALAGLRRLGYVTKRGLRLTKAGAYVLAHSSH